MNTQKEKQNQLAMRRQTLLASQNVLSKEIDEVIKMLDPIGLDDFLVVKARPGRDRRAPARASPHRDAWPTCAVKKAPWRAGCARASREPDHAGWRAAS